MSGHAGGTNPMALDDVEHKTGITPFQHMEIPPPLMT
jgi:hypothetical protein